MLSKLGQIEQEIVRGPLPNCYQDIVDTVSKDTNAL